MSIRTIGSQGKIGMSGELPWNVHHVVRHEALKIPRVKRARRTRVGLGDEGDRERRQDWNGGLQEPSGLKCP